KTRLAEELAAAADGMQIGWGGAVDDAGMPPLWPWIRAVRDFPVPRAALASVAAGAAQREYSSAEDAVATTFTADTGVVDALAEQSRSGPGLLVVLDDLQWADGATLRLLERIAPEAARPCVLGRCCGRGARTPPSGRRRDACRRARSGPRCRGAERSRPGGGAGPDGAAARRGLAERGDRAAAARGTGRAGGRPFAIEHPGPLRPRPGPQRGLRVAAAAAPGRPPPPGGRAA